MTELEYDPSSYEIDEDPYPLYKRLRDEAPLYRNEKLDFWALSRFQDVWDASTDFATYSSAKGTTLEEQPQVLPMMIWMDPPDQTRLRNLVSKAFTPRRVEALKPAIETIAAELLDPHVGSGGMEAIDDFTGKLPMNVISQLLGIPRQDRDQVRTWSNLLMHREAGSVEHTEQSMVAGAQLLGYFDACIKERQQRPRDDMMTALVQAELEGDDGDTTRLSPEELLGFCILLAVAGNETVTKLLGNGIYWLWRNPQQRALLVREPDRIPAAVEEMLRYDPPSHYQGRTTTREVEWYGQTIPADSKVLLLTGSSGRDEREFEDPDRFDVTREIKRHLAFGIRRHICLGANLARMEARVALAALLQRFPEYEVDIDGAQRVHSSNVRGYARLPLRF